ncbi:MAG: hypothetical protein M1812_006736 [Candelaria pacifica]|nr:MAG: hypothetical protein M1812_006736 [Candelaria pacifica]
MANGVNIDKIAMVGCGSMGGGMALLFAEHGITVSLEDPSDENVNRVLEAGKKDGLQDKLQKHQGYEELCKSLGSPKVFIFSLPHGNGDIILDASNENWENTQRRQGKLVAQGVYYIGMGVSGGYQAARRGPSMCPGGQDIALDMVLPMLKKVAAKDGRGRPCVAKAGVGGAGHYVKMIHNGIEHGMMSAIAEAWQIMEKCMDMKEDAVGDVFAKWNAEGELRGTFLIDIGHQICQTIDKEGRHVIDYVQDKVVQDVDGSEGTGIWSNQEAIRLHIPAPSLTSAHYIRLVSANRASRQHVQNTLHGDFSREGKITFENDTDKQQFLEDLRQAVYCACLASYVQGMIIIDKADRENIWDIDFENVIQIWRGGCIIQADYIGDMLEDILKNNGKAESRNLLYESRVAEDLKKTFPALKRIVSKGVEVNAVIPTMSATLEYLKYAGNLDLPTQFYEAELDYFGKHMFDLKSEPAGKPVTGKHHYEWKPA